MERGVEMNKVLVIDDDEDIRKMLQLYLEKENYRVEVAENGREGIKKFNLFNPDIVLIDVMMPELNGYDVLGKIREKLDTPAIMITAKGQQSDKVLGFMKGCDDYLVKPFDLTELSFRIRAILKRMNRTINEDDGVKKKLYNNKN